jgi:hypothetical protein
VELQKGHLGRIKVECALRLSRPEVTELPSGDFPDEREGNPMRSTVLTLSLHTTPRHEALPFNGH